MICLRLLRYEQNVIGDRVTGRAALLQPSPERGSLAESQRIIQGSAQLVQI